MKLLKIYVMFCPPARAKCPSFFRLNSKLVCPSLPIHQLLTKCKVDVEWNLTLSRLCSWSTGVADRYLPTLHSHWIFFNCYLAAPWPTLGHYWGGSLTHLMVITCILHIQPEGHWEPCNEVGSLSPTQHLVGFK